MRGVTDRTRIALACLHISAAIYIAVGLFFLWLARSPDFRGEGEVVSTFSTDMCGMSLRRH
jgi:hypothetical protein